MAQEFLPTPTDEQTGLPLPLLLPEPAELAAANVNYHHHFFPARDLRLYYGVGGRTLRYSRGQTLPTWMHDRFHQCFEGPPLPQRDEIGEQFRLSVLACANVVGPYALDMSQDDVTEPVLLTPAQQAYISQSRHMHIESAFHPTRARRIHDHIGRFFALYALQQELGHVRPALIEEFLETPVAERKLEIGNLLLREAVQAAVDPVSRIEQRLQSDGYVMRHRPRSVVRRFFNKAYFHDYHGELARRLRGEPALAQA